MRPVPGHRRSLLLPAVCLHSRGAACARTVRLPDLGGLYNAAAQRHEPWRNPVIVIAGILGSRLRDGETHRLVWGAFSGDYADPRRADGARQISLPMRPGAPLSERRDTVHPDGALDGPRVSVFGVHGSLRGYEHGT